VTRTPPAASARGSDELSTGSANQWFFSFINYQHSDRNKMLSQSDYGHHTRSEDQNHEIRITMILRAILWRKKSVSICVFELELTNYPGQVQPAPTGYFIRPLVASSQHCFSVSKFQPSEQEYCAIVHFFCNHWTRTTNTKEMSIFISIIRMRSRMGT
jgi:hypothetical protein